MSVCEKRYRLAIGAALIVAWVSSASAIADEVRLPAPSSPLTEGAEYVGVIGGLKAWRTPDAPALMFLAPDERTVLIGFAFSGEGRDLNAGYTGGPEQPLARLFPTTPAIDSQAADLAEHSEPSKSPVAPDLGEPHLNELVSRLDKASTQEELQKTIVDWAKETNAAGRRTQETSGAGEEISAGITFDNPTRAPGSAEPSPSSYAEEAGPAETKADELLRSFETEGFWFNAGSTEPDVPVVYAAIDPECPYCARALQELKEPIEAGRLQLRVLLTPIVSNTSGPRSLAVMTAEHPAKALLEHGESKAKFGKTSLSLPEPRSIPETKALAFQGAMERNKKVLKDNGFRAVPLFVWAEGGKARQQLGLPDAQEPQLVDLFEKADPRPGERPTAGR